MKTVAAAKNPYVSLACNFLYGAGNCAWGFLTHSWWFVTVGAYYAVLAATRFSVLQIRRRAGGDPELERFAERVTGILLVALSFCLIGVNVLSAVEKRGTVFHGIVMIAIAAYTFTKMTLAIVGMAKAGREASPAQKTLRNISFADGIVSVYTLQRAMLVSFPGMESGEIFLFNILTGTAVWLTVLLLGVNLIGGKVIKMARAKILRINKKIAAAVTGGYRKIEKATVDGYKRVERGVTGGYRKIEDWFIGAYLKKDGETLEKAKARLKNKGN